MTLSPMVRGYLEAALWASTDEDGEPLGEGRDLDDFAPSAVDRAIADCDEFYQINADDCDESRLDFPALGHDLWLTRNRHGAGFWDRGLGALGERLTDAAHGMGSCDYYVGDDGMVRFA